MTWKDKTCEECRYRVGMDCRRFPPQILHSVNFKYNHMEFLPRYPLTVECGHHDDSKNGEFIAACAEFREAP